MQIRCKTAFGKTSIREKSGKVQLDFSNIILIWLFRKHPVRSYNISKKKGNVMIVMIVMIDTIRSNIFLSVFFQSIKSLSGLIHLYFSNPNATLAFFESKFLSNNAYAPVAVCAFVSEVKPTIHLYVAFYFKCMFRGPGT